MVLCRGDVVWDESCRVVSLKLVTISHCLELAVFNLVTVETDNITLLVNHFDNQGRNSKSQFWVQISKCVESWGFLFKISKLTLSLGLLLIMLKEL
jgi:hypothetical protein